MSFDSDIRYYKNKIAKIEKAIPNIRTAIKEYNEAIAELTKIKGVARCDTLKSNIQNKINELERLIISMNKEIENYQAKIRSLQRQKAAQENTLE